MINNTYILILGIISGVCTTISFIPQVINIIMSNKVDNLSPITFTIHLCGVILWCIYGFLIKNYIIITFNFITLLLCTIILYYIIIDRLKNKIDNNDIENNINTNI